MKKMLWKRWEMEKDVIAIKMKGVQGKDDFRRIEHWMKYEVK